MNLKRPPGLFVTGTGTGVGKTYVASLLARSLAAAGRRVGVYKPAASGCDPLGGALVSEDAVKLWEAAGRPGELERVCPQRFAAPLAPPLAARQEGRTVDEALLRSGLDYWLERSETVIVEGAGGLMSPLSDNDYVADVAFDLGLPLLVVAQNVLGTIHHTLATLVVAATFHDGLDVAGVVLNNPASVTLDASAASNLAELRARCVPPVLGELKYGAAEFHPPIDWQAMLNAIAIAASR